jgi:hypothetical protein
MILEPTKIANELRTNLIQKNEKGILLLDHDLMVVLSHEYRLGTPLTAHVTVVNAGDVNRSRFL